jgi:probable HAF family extracellular repeat protein
VYEAGVFTSFDAPGPSEPWAINDNGQIVGYYTVGGTSHGFLYDNGVLMTIDPPGALYSGANGVNNQGQIVGHYSDSQGVHGFLYDKGVFTSFDVPNAPQTFPLGINNYSQIVGYVQDSRGQVVGFFATPTEGDTTPPVITISASPATLSPPNGRLVPVTVSGTITDEPGGSGVQEGSAAYQVIDEYGQIQPSGNVTLADSKYSFTVALQASRRGNDQDGRHYTIVVNARDNAGKLGRALATVTVPRN